ncbi:MAG: universal stress protein [Chloroflexi bacterium]|nr:universal stress protein [Chloroflexota bacterium]
MPLDGSAHAEAALAPAQDLAAVLRARLLLLRVVPPPRLPYVHAHLHPYAAAGDPLSEQEVLCVAPRPRVEGPGLTGDSDLPPATVEDLIQAEQYLEQVASRLRLPSTPIDTRTYVGAPVDTIVSFAQAEGIEAIAMATHGRVGLVRVVLGSVATGVVQRAGRPLLLVRPAALRFAP